MTDRMPSSVNDDLSLFDRFASRISRGVSKAPFFAAAMLIVVLWLIEGAVIMASQGPSAFLNQSYQIQINTVTTVITFLLVALLQNTQARDNEAIQEKLNAVAQGLSHTLEALGMDEDVEELEQAVGLETHVGSDDQA